MATEVKPDQNANSEPDEDNNICRDYKRGVCNRGNKCKFAHPTSIKPPDADKPPICRDFQNGTCDRNNCKYMHITTNEERAFASTGKLPAHVNYPGTPGPPAGPRKNGGPGGDVCKDFLNSVCNRGSRCKFRHLSEQEWESEKRRGEVEDDMTRKRKREDFGGGSLDYQFLSDENDMLRRKVADLQRQVADLRAMNDTLYEQNMRYRSQLKSEMASDSRSTGGAVSYPGYPPRDREQPVRYPPRDSTTYPERPAVASQPGGYAVGYSKDYNPSFNASGGTASYEGYTKF